MLVWSLGTCSHLLPRMDAKVNSLSVRTGIRLDDDRLRGLLLTICVVEAVTF